jgi:DNA-binding MarR family transcriptional regulator
MAADPDLERIAEFTELVAASARSPRQRERMARAVGLPITAANLAALRIVQRQGPVAVIDVARRLGLDQSTASRQLRPLEEHGLVTRTGDPADRRVALLRVTPAGEDLLGRVRAMQLNDFDVALSDWDPAQRHTLAVLLERFRHDLLAARTDETGWTVRKEPVPGQSSAVAPAADGRRGSTSGTAR